LELADQIEGIDIGILENKQLLLEGPLNTILNNKLKNGYGYLFENIFLFTILKKLPMTKKPYNLLFSIPISAALVQDNIDSKGMTTCQYFGLKIFPDFAFELVDVAEKKKFVLCANNAASKKEWLETLNNVIELNLKSLQQSQENM
jgi:hypothetical protein